MSRALGGVILWLEIRFDAGVVQNFVDLGSIMNITGANDTNTSTSEPNLDLRTFERFRFVVNTLLIHVTGAQGELIIPEIILQARGDGCLYFPVIMCYCKIFDLWMATKLPNS